MGHSMPNHPIFKKLFRRHLKFILKDHPNTYLWKTNSCKILAPNYKYFLKYRPLKIEVQPPFLPCKSKNQVDDIIVNAYISDLNRDRGLKLVFP